MATFVLSAGGVFPEGTSVGAYPASRWGPDVPSGAPIGAAVESKSVSGGTATFTTLTAGTEYYFTASVSGTYRYLSGTAGEDEGPQAELVSDIAAVSAAYRQLINGYGARLDAAAANTYGLNPGGAVAPAAIANFMQFAVHLDPADFAIEGRTTKYRIRASCLANATASTVNFTVGLYPVSAVAGAAAAVTGTVGAVVTGSTVAFTAPAANSLSAGNSGDLTPPAAGWYLLGVVVSGAMAASSAVAISAGLQVRNVAS